jgi:GAF domain-containing protein
VSLADASLRPYLSMLRAEGIAALTFIPLVNRGRVIGKFMLYYESPYAPSEGELRLARIIASQVAFAVARTRAKEQARRSESRLRFALDASAMTTLDWDLTSLDHVLAALARDIEPWTLHPGGRATHP